MGRGNRPGVVHNLPSKARNVFGGRSGGGGGGGHRGARGGGGSGGGGGAGLAVPSPAELARDFLDTSTWPIPRHFTPDEHELFAPREREYDGM